MLEAAAIEGQWTRRKLSTQVRAAFGVEVGDTRNAGKQKPGLPRPTDAAHVYGCWVERVVDGDTLIVQLDLGFEVIRRQRLRLAGLDVEELGTRSRQGYRYVMDELGKAASVVVKTTRVSDAYGRYVGFVFYAMDEGATVGDVFEHGRFLNADLIATGHATQAPVH
jgi:endonuclease YncB( thermonuclease family)